MLSVWTGLPGSGKTSHVIEKVLMPLAKKDWIEHGIDDEGNKVEIKRRLFTNINGLLLEHEKIDADDLNRWHEWVKPGDLIVFDEVQKPWPLTGANKEQPKCISELETHRHYGIDMHLLTQHPMLINAAIVRLAGQHKHIRKVGNSRFATVYEWDGVSRTLLYKNAMAKKPWRRGKAVEKMYRSSALHTKQKRAIPTVLWVLIAAVVAMPFAFADFTKSFHARYFGGKTATEAATGKPASQAQAGGAGAGAAGAPGAPVERAAPFVDDRVAFIPRVSYRPDSAPAYDELRKVSVVPRVAGAVLMGKRVRCVTQQGTDAGLSEGECRQWLASPPFDPFTPQTAYPGPQGAAAKENAAQDQQGPRLIAIEGPGWRDPQGYRGTQRQ